MICPASVSIATLTIQRLRTSPASPRNARVLGITGYPYTGKTNLASEIAASWPRDATILPTETVVLARAERLKRDIDGCSPAAHDIPRLVQNIQRLRSGQPIFCESYSWATGSAQGSTLVPGVGAEGLVIVDGTVAAVESVLNECDLVLCIAPAAYSSWLRDAATRDEHERAWDAESAYFQNIRKSATSGRLLKLPDGSRSLHVVVDSSSWTWFLPGCGQCEELIGNLAVQPPVTAAGCQLR